MAESASLLRLEDVHVHYGAIEAVKGLSFEVRQGEIVTLVGSNGAGKTTTLRAISGIRRASKGRILFEGASIEGESAHRIVARGISHSPEGRHIFGRMSVRENLVMGAFLRSKDKTGIAEDLDRIYGLFPVLKERERQAGGTLSGGEQQMLAIGRALMSRPRLLILDEPSLGLAPIIVRRIFDLLREIHAQGLTILLVEQNANQALKIADRGYVLESGTIVLEGPARDLLGNDAVRRAYLGGGAAEAS